MGETKLEPDPVPVEEMINYFPSRQPDGSMRMGAGVPGEPEKFAVVCVAGDEYFQVATANVFSSLGALVQGGHSFEDLERAAQIALDAWRPFVKRAAPNYHDMTAAGQKLVNEFAP